MPEGLDLEAWINPPPEESESEEEEEIANLGQVNITNVCSVLCMRVFPNRKSWTCLRVYAHCKHTHSLLH